MTDSRWELPIVLLLSSTFYFALWHYISLVIGQ